MAVAGYSLISQAVYKLIHHCFSFDVLVTRPAQSTPVVAMAQKSAKITPSAAKPSSAQVMGA